MNHNNYRSRHLSLRSKRGSALIAAVLCSFVVMILAGSYLKMATNEYKASVRSTLYSSSLNLAESGVEMAIAALQDGSVTTATWTGSSIAYLQDGAYQGDVYYVITDALSTDPVIHAEGILRGHVTGDVTKQVRVELDAGIAPFETGLSARNGITFSGNGVVLDSYNSKYGAYGSLLASSSYAGTIPADFGDGGYNRNDDIYIASDALAVVGIAVAQGNADVYGYVAIGPGSTASIGPNGKVTSYDSGTHDASRVLGDFYADFPVITDPGELSTGGSYGLINSTTTINGSASKDAPTQYDVAEISLTGNNKSIIINGHVRLIMGGDISIGGNSNQFVVNSGGSLTIYTDEDISITGNGIVNSDGVAEDFFIYGTAATTFDGSGNESAGQSISIRGNGQLAASVYAPSAAITMNGGGTNGSVFGGMVGFTASVTGGSAFHFDEALRDITFGGGSYTIESWLEMTRQTAATTPVDFSVYSF